MWAPERQFATDMAGFALNLKTLLQRKWVPKSGQWLQFLIIFSMNFSATFHAGCGADVPETCFLLQFNILPNETEPFGYNNKPKEILGKEMEMHK